MGNTSDQTRTPRYQWLKSAALILALALVTTRCLTSEFLRDPVEVMPGGTAAPRGVGAAMGVVLDLACCLPALLVLLQGALTKTRRRIGPAAGLFFIFAVFAAASFCWTSDRYVAAIGASHLLAAAALLWAMAQLVGDGPSVASIAAICLGILLCLLAQGIYYGTVELPDLRDRWINDVAGTRTNLLHQHNWEAGSFAAKQFALKILHGDFAAFYTSANTYAAMLALLGVVVAGIFLSDARNRKNWVLALILIPLFWMLWLTQCKAAFVTIALAAVTFILLRFFSSILNRYRRAIFFLGIAVFLGIAGLTTVYGMRHGNLPNDSLNFRWRYWVAAAHMFPKHPVAGVGWNNFGEHYLSARLPAASEEIKDPHNMLVRVFIELGVIGGGLFIAFLLTTWWRMTAPTRPAATESGIIGARGLILVVMLAIAINVATTIDFSQIPAYVFLEVMRRFLFLALLLISIIFGLDPQRKDLIAAPMRWLPAAIAVGLGFFLIHNLIDFALFDPSPGPMMLFAMLTGALIGIRSDRIAKARFAWGRFAVSAVVFMVAAFAFVVPVVWGDAEFAQADNLFRSSKIEEAIPFYGRAGHLVPYNAEYPFRLAEALIYDSASRSAVDAAIDSALRADPFYIDAYLLRARYLQRLTHPDVPAIIAAYNKALLLNPNDVSIRLEYASFLQQADKPADAIEQYEKALWFNDQFPPDEAKRLPPGRVAEIQQTIHQLQEHP